MGEFVSLLANSSDLVGDSDTCEESESDIELSTSLSSDSEHEDEESDIVDDSNQKSTFPRVWRCSLQIVFKYAGVLG